jgi:hypothetical protein
MLEPREILEEVARRWGPRILQQEKAAAQRVAVLATRFDKQRALIESKSRRRAGFCPRRSGKTEANVGLLLDGALDGSGHIVVFVAKTRQRAKDLTWKAIEDACDAHGIESAPKLAELRRVFANRSEVRWVGADDLRDLRNKRGDKLRRVVIDEAQDFDVAILEALVRDVFGPSLEDLGGDLILTGTPAEACVGPWYELTSGDSPSGMWHGWDVHRWTPFDNPHIPLIHQRLRSGEIAKDLGGEDSPTYQREWLGRWVNDTGTLFYAFEQERNTHERPEDELRGDGWFHVLGWDIGLRDSMAKVAWAFHRNDPTLYEADSWKKSGALVDECAEKYREMDGRFDFVAKVADTGGAGALFVAEVAKRHGITFEAAKKTEKAQHVRLFNDELRAGRIKVRKGSAYHQEIARLPKVKEWNEAQRGKPTPEDPRFPNDACDAGLYAWRWAFNYLHEAKDSAPPKGTPEAYALEEEQLEERLTQAAQDAAAKEWWE